MYDGHKEIRERLNAMRFELLRRQTEVRRDLRREKDELVKDADDRAIQLANDEALAAIDEATSRDIASVEAGLGKLTANTYGWCDACGEQIAKARLAALPQAHLCAQCADRGT